MWQLYPTKKWVKWRSTLEQKVDKIMSTIADLKTVADGIAAKMGPLKAGVDAANQHIADLTAALAAAGTTLPADQQAMLDGAVAELGGVSTQVDAIQGSLNPAPPPAPAPAPAPTG